MSDSEFLRDQMQKFAAVKKHEFLQMQKFAVAHVCTPI